MPWDTTRASASARKTGALSFIEKNSFHAIRHFKSHGDFRCPFSSIKSISSNGWTLGARGLIVLYASGVWGTCNQSIGRDAPKRRRRVQMEQISPSGATVKRIRPVSPLSGNNFNSTILLPFEKIRSSFQLQYRHIPKHLVSVLV